MLTKLINLNPSNLFSVCSIDHDLSLPPSQGHPDDIFPMVLTSATQELFGCLADEDVTGENPYKLLKKDDIIQDIKTRAAVSDFSPVKQIVLVRLIHCHTHVSLRQYPQDTAMILRPQVKGCGNKPVTSLTSFLLCLTERAATTISLFFQIILHKVKGD